MTLKINIVFILLCVLLSQCQCEEQERIYFIFTPHCYENLIKNMDISDTECIKYTMSKIMGYMMVAGGAIVKIPQLMKIIVDKSVFGISYPSVILQISTNWTMVVYNWYRGNPFSLYGENVFIGLQNLIIMAFFVVYIRNVPKGVEIPHSSAHLKYLIYFVIFVLTMMITKNPFNWPEQVIKSSIIIQMTLISSARIAQIYHIFKCKSTGTLSLFTCTLNTLGNVNRLFTVLVEAGDDHLFAMSIVSTFILNVVIIVQFFIYWDNSKIKKQ